MCSLGRHGHPPLPMGCSRAQCKAYSPATPTPYRLLSAAARVGGRVGGQWDQPGCLRMPGIGAGGSATPVCLSPRVTRAGLGTGGSSAGTWERRDLASHPPCSQTSLDRTPPPLTPQTTKGCQKSPAGSGRQAGLPPSASGSQGPQAPPASLPAQQQKRSPGRTQEEFIPINIETHQASGGRGRVQCCL